MSTHETPQFVDDPNRYRQISLATTLDQEWCDSFTAAFGSAGYTAMLETPMILAEDFGRHWRRRGRARSLGFVSLLKEVNYYDTVVVEGRVMGARMITEYVDGFDEYSAQLPYIVLANLVQTHPLVKEPIARNEFDYLHVPLYFGGEELLLIRDGST